MGFCQWPENGFRSGQKGGFLGARVGESGSKPTFLLTWDPSWDIGKNPILTPFKGGGTCLPKRALKAALTQHKSWGLWVTIILACPLVGSRSLQLGRFTRGVAERVCIRNWLPVHRLSAPPDRQPCWHAYATSHSSLKLQQSLGKGTRRLEISEEKCLFTE